MCPLCVRTHFLVSKLDPLLQKWCLSISRRLQKDMQEDAKHLQTLQQQRIVQQCLSPFCLLLSSQREDYFHIPGISIFLFFSIVVFRSFLEKDDEMMQDILHDPQRPETRVKRMKQILFIMLIECVSKIGGCAVYVKLGVKCIARVYFARYVCRSPFFSHVLLNESNLLKILFLRMCFKFFFYTKM